MRLGELLIEANVIDEQALSEALDRQRGTTKRIGTVLVEMGLADDHEVVAALGTQFNLPGADLRHDPPLVDAVMLLAEDVARSLSAIPVRVTPIAVEVAVAGPLDGLALADLEEAVGGPVSIQLAPAGEIREAIDQSYTPEVMQKHDAHIAWSCGWAGWYQDSGGRRR